MKRLLIIATTLCPFLLMAQTESQGNAKLNDQSAVKEFQQDKETFPGPNEAINPQETDDMLLRPKHLHPGINRLPLDGTPCLVPDADKTVAIPNAWKGPLRVPFKKKKPAASYNETVNSPVLF
ncbi:MAG: hypothetical protein EOO14_26760 [Chitinophagaceae bacterium]|nr:MAG: hypothetical protein EOO14_26760 [Chitinophagaceae bacterium]